MLNLSVSSKLCLPGIPNGDTQERPALCFTCGAPGGERGHLLEDHLVGGNRKIYLCPLCHVCLHLDVAGRMKAGRIIWLPELSQVELNILCLATFIVLRKAGVYRKDAPTQAMRSQIILLYKTFEKRAEAVEMFLCDGANRGTLPTQSLSSPTHIASLIVRAQRDTKLDAKTLAKRMNGLRLLPSPQPFEGYIAQVARIATNSYPVNTWMESVEAHLATIDATAQPQGDSEGQFDADLEPGYA